MMKGFLPTLLSVPFPAATLTSTCSVSLCKKDCSFYVSNRTANKFCQTHLLFIFLSPSCCCMFQITTLFKINVNVILPCTPSSLYRYTSTTTWTSIVTFFTGLNSRKVTEKTGICFRCASLSFKMLASVMNCYFYCNLSSGSFYKILNLVPVSCAHKYCNVNVKSW